ncbi:DedA family protein [Pseudoclavibacter sp. RFBJ3]|uniref:DedA family protein n=1 Tax=unclassified Pseudoclavibacter TaxID=2615177 RepID=UPI000CE78779|nr:MULTISPECIES: DedA family protein [unclassified Pseudoclavibacter]PPF85332.1 DedA family protein [Pseudoclavibacter sp. RFBJ5]PPF93273.1 DedA family protein [Pseudoclavibacter sp. RFBJ3]PPF98919.1 DedA family protein [Pseudoclavibacter sp. RFBH5]PPG24948.1 DedA family protein [Pseudoclavibacter sp. RFBI4]
MNELIETALQYIESVPPVWRIVLVGVAILLETSVLIGLIVPGETVLLALSTGIDAPLPWVLTIAASIVGALLGESFGFWLGRTFGPRIRASRVGRWLGDERWQRAELLIQRRGGPAVLISRFLPVLHSLVPLTAGMGGMRYRSFLAWTIPACVIWSTAYVSAAAGASASFRELSSSLHWAGYLFVGVIVVFLLIMWLVKRAVGKVMNRDLDEANAQAAAASADRSTSHAPTGHDDSDAETAGVRG